MPDPHPIVTRAADTDEILTRSAIVTRAADTDDGAHQIEALVVPWDTETEIFPGWFELFERGAVRADDIPPLLFWQHAEPIGRITALDDRDDGLHMTARISDTERGREAWTLVADGTLSRVSIGFLPVASTEAMRETEGREEYVTTRTDAIIRECSIVSFPAYHDAAITASRSDHHPTRPTPRKDHTMDPEEIAKLRDGLASSADLAALDRRLETIAAGITPATPAIDHRTAGQLIRDMLDGDADTVAMVNAAQTRAYAGSTTADVDLAGGLPTPAGIESLVKVVDNANPVAQLFKTAPLPASGMAVQFLTIKNLTVTVGAQTKPGDNLPGPSKVSFQTASSPIKVAGGWTELDIATVQRFDVPTLDTILTAMAVQLGKNRADDFATALTAAIKGRASAALSLSSFDSADAWSDAIVDAQLAYADTGWPCDGLLVSVDLFKALRRLKDSSGRYLMRTWGDSVNQQGSINGLSGQLGPMRVTPFIGAAANTGTFYNAAAVSSRVNPVVQLQDTNIVNLTGQWSVYQLSAVCTENPGLLVPIKKAA